MRGKQYNTKSLYFPDRIPKAMAGIFDYPLTVVEAPMGYGKTTAVREYLNKTGARVLWQMVYDNSPGGFWKGFSRLFANMNEDCSQSLTQLGFPGDSVLMREALRIIGEIEFPAETVLVIDDYHLIENPVVNRLMELLALDDITNLHIVLTTRYTGLQNREELALKGYLLRIMKEVFEFAPQEIVEYYKVCGINLKDFEADQLYSLTEGWISALYLFMLELIAEGGYTPEKSIHKLIERAVYAPLPEETKDFLLMMCIFDGFTLEQAAHLWGKANEGELLDEITNKNAFVKYDFRMKTYQIHNIFSSFLKEIFKKKNADYQKAIYRKAAEWHIRNKDYLAAADYFYRSQDFDALLGSYEHAGTKNSIGSEHKALLIKHLEDCPEPIRAKHHLALLIYTFRMFTFNESDLFQKSCGELIGNIQADRDLEQKSKDKLLGEFELILSFTKYNDIKGMAEHYRKARKLLNEPSFIFDERGIWTFGAPSVLYMFYRESGMLERHVEDLIADIHDYYWLTNGCGSGAEYVMEAEKHFCAGNFVNAEISAHRALNHARSKMQSSIIICAMFLQIRLAFLKADYPGMTEILRKMRADIINGRQYLLIHTLDLCEGYIDALLNQTKKIPKWIREGGISSSRLMFPVHGAFDIVYGRTLLAAGDYLKLIGSADHFIGIASVFPNLLGQIYIYIYLAAANIRILRETAALSSLRRALDIALPDRMYMPFVENCDYIKPLLEKLYRDGLYREGIRKILELCVVYQKAAEQIVTNYFTGEKPKLTGRELEVARLAAEGQTNKEIGARLYISENTVKKQLKTIFEKLGIGSRALLKQSLGD